jgi:CheY-like chemotaxis protein
VFVDARILLVEDDASIRETTSLGLERAGLDVTTASTGDEALDRFRRERFDLLVLDLMRPASTLRRRRDPPTSRADRDAPERHRRRRRARAGPSRSPGRSSFRTIARAGCARRPGRRGERIVAATSTSTRSGSGRTRPGRSWT